MSLRSASAGARLGSSIRARDASESEWPNGHPVVPFRDQRAQKVYCILSRGPDDRVVSSNPPKRNTFPSNSLNSPSRSRIWSMTSIGVNEESNASSFRQRRTHCRSMAKLKTRPAIQFIGRQSLQRPSSGCIGVIRRSIVACEFQRTSTEALKERQVVCRGLEKARGCGKGVLLSAFHKTAKRRFNFCSRFRPCDFYKAKGSPPAGRTRRQ